ARQAQCPAGPDRRARLSRDGRIARQFRVGEHTGGLRVSMTRFVQAACCALLPLSVWAQLVPSPRAKPPANCPLQPADCQINSQVFDFGRGQMSSVSSPINGNSTISVTCTRAQRDGLNVTVLYQLKAVPAEPARQMPDSE